jgi:hypothetical protein
MNKKWSKKASLNLSIEAIVIIVIAFTVLGLGLGFVKTQLGTAGDTTSMVQDQIKQQILDDLRTGNKKLTFPAQTINIEKGASKDIAIGVKNTQNSGDLNFELIVETLEKQGAKGADVSTQVEYFYLKGPFTLKVTDAEAYNIKVTASGDKGTYLVSLKVMDTTNPDVPYAEKSFFVNVI